MSRRVLRPRRGALPGPASLWTLLALLVGLAAGVGGYTLVYAEGFSYMSSDPKVCVNCHIMQPQYDSWQKSSHHAVAGCVDCHLPHDFVGKWTAKALNGFNHSAAFTAQNFPEPITITPRNARILQESCLGCHAAIVHEAVYTAGRSEEISCVHCHQSVGHGERAGLGGPRR